MIKVRDIVQNGDSLHVDGSLLTASGQDHKMVDMFMSPLVIKPYSKDGREYIVLSHPAAKICFDRPSGTSWFTARRSHDEAMQRATRLKCEWEKEFRIRASKYGGAQLCLRTSSGCDICSGNDHTIQVKRWNVIRECSLGAQAAMLHGDHIAGGKLRQVCDQYLKNRGRRAKDPPPKGQ